MTTLLILLVVLVFRSTIMKLVSLTMSGLGITQADLDSSKNINDFLSDKKNHD